jgi:hypothetical protein
MAGSPSVVPTLPRPVSGRRRPTFDRLESRDDWRYWKVDLDGTTPSQEITDVPWGATNASFFSLRKEGRVFLGALGADFSSTTLYEATADGFVNAATVTGYLQSLSLL